MPKFPSKKQDKKKTNRTSPKSANKFANFLASNFKKFKKGKTSMGQATKSAAKRWQNMSTEEKSMFNCDVAPKKLSTPKQKPSGVGSKRNLKSARNTNENSRKTRTVKSIKGNQKSVNEKVSYARKGIENYKNNCWLNSLLQCLSRTVIGNLSQQDDGPCTTLLFSYLIHAMVSLRDVNANHIPYGPKLLLDKLSQQGLTKGQQQDVHEAFTKLFDECSEDLEGKTVGAVSSFWGSIQYVNTCCTCGKDRESSEDKFISLAVELPRKGTETTVRDCIEKFLKEEVLVDENKVECSRCKMNTNHLRKGFIKVPPQTLAIVIKRRQPGGYKKDNSPVSIERMIDLTAFQTCSSQSLTYQVTSAVLHKGPLLNAGHYTALYIADDQERITLCDDHIVEERPAVYLDKRSVKNEIYILFYNRV
jgi:ubiquitin C-terminal hydrolase